MESVELVPAPEVPDAEVVAVLPPDPATMDLTEARRIVAGGAGLRGREEFALLARVAAALGASVGGTRVVADADLIPFERQIGTTGAMVDPDLYLAFGISGAVQHVNGLGNPDAVVSVNTDPSCPMMAMADLALVTDAEALLGELARRLGVGDPATSRRRTGGAAQCLTTRGLITTDTRTSTRSSSAPGPAGATAALVLARAGRSVALLERGAYPGAKNMYGGVVYGRVLDELVPQWWRDVPYQRWISRRATMLMTPTQSLTVDYRSDKLDRAAVQRDDRLPRRLRRLARRQGGGGGRHSGLLDHGDRAAARRTTAGSAG